MDLEDELVAHRKVDVLDLAFVEMGGSEGDVIDLGVVEIAVVERTIDKGDAHEGGFWESAMVENTTLKIGVVEAVLGVGEVGEVFL